MQMDKDDFRKLFHSVTNELYKITVRTGSATKITKIKVDRGITESEFREEFAKLLATLSEIETITMQAAGDIQKLKDAVYAELKFNFDED